MSVRKPRHFTYYERMKSSFEMVQEKTAKSLCDYLLNFIENCVGETRPEVLDFTDKRTEEKISQFLLANRDFFAQLLDNYLEFSSQKEAHEGKDSNKSRILAKTIEKHCYQILCLSALYSPPELQQIYVTKLSSFLIKHGRDTPFGPFELTVWTTLNLLINPVKLKQQCDGSVEMFTHFTKALGKQSGASSQPADSAAKSWANPSLHGTVLLALGVSIKYARNSLGLRIPHEFDEIEFVDDAIKNMALEFIHAYIVQMPYFCDYSFSVDVLDSILKNFICYFPDKLVEIYNLCEEELYSFLEEDGGGAIPSLFGQSSQRRNEAKRLNFANLSFKTLLELIATLYEPESPQLTQLSKEFTDPKCDALCDFIYKGRAISAPPLKIAYLSMLKSLCKSSQSAGVFFGIFK